MAKEFTAHGLKRPNYFENFKLSKAEKTGDGPKTEQKSFSLADIPRIRFCICVRLMIVFCTSWQLFGDVNATALVISFLLMTSTLLLSV